MIRDGHYDSVCVEMGWMCRKYMTENIQFERQLCTKLNDCLSLSPLEKSFNNVADCLLEEQGDEQMSIHYKIVSLHINIKYKVRWEIALFMSVKLLTMQRSVSLKENKKKKTPKNHEHSLVHQRQKQCQIYTQNNKNNNITFFCKSTILSYILQLKLYH